MFIILFTLCRELSDFVETREKLERLEREA